MKHCNNCGRDYETGKYCKYCGALLIDKIEFDIFGDPIERKEKPVEQDRVIYDENGWVIAEDSQNLGSDNLINKKGILKPNKLWEILSLISIGTAFIPLIGIGFSILVSIFNALEYRKNKSQKPFMIIAFVMLAVAVLFTLILFLTGVMKELIVSILEE